MGTAVALLPLTRLGPILENNRDGEGSPGEEDIAATAAWGGVTAMGEQEGKEERVMVAIAILAKRNLRLKEMRRVRIRLSSSYESQAS